MYKAANWEKFNDKKYLQELKENIINEDNKYFNSEERKNEKWQVKDFRNRKIKTKYGLLEVRIRYYFKPEKNKIIYSFCPYLNFVKYQRFSNNLAIEVIDKILYGMNYRDIRKSINNNICIGTISNLFRKLKPENSKKDFKEETKNQKILYLHIDDTYTKLSYSHNQKKMHRIRMIYSHLVNEDKKNIAKSISLEIRETNDKDYSLKNIIDKIKEKIKKVYSKKLKIVIYGDGARFIKTIAKSLSAIYILDKFHLKSKLFKLLGYKKYRNKNYKIFKKIDYQNSEKLFDRIYDLLSNKEVKSAINILEKLIDNSEKYGLPNYKINEIISFIKYLKNNEEGLYFYNSDLDIGSKTESSVSHFVKKNTRKKFTCFSKIAFQNLIFLNQKNDKMIDFF